MCKLIMMVGVPGSGKSTYANNIAKLENAVVLSSDELREELFGNVWEFRRNRILFNELYKRAFTYLSMGESVVLDATNITSRLRKSVLKRFKSYYKECYFIQAPLAKILYQNRVRERHVPESVIRSMYERLQPPGYDEGWDRIVVVKDRKISYCHPLPK